MHSFFRNIFALPASYNAASEPNKDISGSTSGGTMVSSKALGSMRWAIYSALPLVLLAGTASASQINVTPNNMNGWSFTTFFGSGGTGEMVGGPLTPPLGVGSAYLKNNGGGGAEMDLSDSSRAMPP